MRGRKRGRWRRGISRAGDSRGGVVVDEDGGDREGLSENLVVGGEEGGVQLREGLGLGEKTGGLPSGCGDASVMPELGGGDVVFEEASHMVQEQVKDRSVCLEGGEGLPVEEEKCRADLASVEPDNVGALVCVPAEDEQRPKKKRRASNRIKVRPDAPLRRSARRAAINGSPAPPNGVITSDKPPYPDTDAAVEENIEKNLEGHMLPLPPSSTNLNLDELPVLDVFSVYSCLRSFSTLLFLSPFSLEVFVEALRCNYVNPLIDWVHFSILHVLKVHLERLSEEGIKSASNCLRCLDWNLLDLVTWPIYLAGYLLLHGSYMKPCFKLTELKLLDADYYRQSAVIKLEILRCLCDDVVEAEVFRSELGKRVLETEPDADNEQNAPYDCRNKGSSLNDPPTSPSHSIDGENVDWNNDECCLCKLEGNLICCDGCPAAFHSRCVGVARDTLPEGDWFCPDCLVGKADQPAIPPSPCRGAEFLGVDFHGRIFLGSCGYVLVSDSCNADLFHYYHKNDLSSIIEVMMASSQTLYTDIITRICKYYGVCGDFTCPIFHVDELKEAGCINPNSESLDSLPGFLFPNKCSDSTLDNLQSTTIQAPLSNPNNAPISSGSGVMEELSSQSNGQIKTCGTQLQYEPSGYINYYKFGRIASCIAEGIEDFKKDQNISADETISSQKNMIFKKLLGFSWSVLQKLILDEPKECCGWCFTCKNSDSQDCLFNLVETEFLDGLKDSHRSKILEGSKNLPLGHHSVKNRKSHFFSAVYACLSIEDNLQGLLSGPWDNPSHRKYWCTDVLKSTDIASLKPLLLALESNMRRIVLSAEWVKPVDNDLTVGSASHILLSAINASSRKWGGRRRARKSVSEGKKNTFDFGNDSRSLDATSSSIYWWRGGRLSRRLFSWKLLPRSMAFKCGRQAGCQRIPGIYYTDGSVLAKRSKDVAWRAAVEKSQSVADLILHVKDLDSNIRWNDLKNTQIFSCSAKESKNRTRALKNVKICRKHVVGNQVSYVLDFGRKKNIPDIVTKQASMHQETSSGRKKYWLNESIIPLGLLKSFELKKLENRDSKLDRMVDVGIVGVHKTKNGKILSIFSYLFSKLQNLYCICGDCKEDMLKREAVSCEFCGGFFHKKHFIIPKGITEAAYMCLSCQNREAIKREIKKPRKKTKLMKGVTTAKSKPLSRREKNLSVKNQKSIKSKRFKKSQAQSKITKILRNLSCYKGTRTPTRHFYWRNGLLWAGKEYCERGASFRSANVLMPVSDTRYLNARPTCNLCHEQYNPDLTYLCCEDCGDWFHGVAFDITTIENIKYINGFKCYKCRRKCPPECPYVRSGSISKIDPLNESNPGEGSLNDTYLHEIGPANRGYLLMDNKTKIEEYSKLDMQYTSSNPLHMEDSGNHDQMAEATGGVAIYDKYLCKDNLTKIEDYSEQDTHHTNGILLHMRDSVDQDQVVGTTGGIENDVYLRRDDKDVLQTNSNLLQMEDSVDQDHVVGTTGGVENGVCLRRDIRDINRTNSNLLHTGDSVDQDLMAGTTGVENDVYLKRDEISHDQCAKQDLQVECSFLHTGDSIHDQQMAEAIQDADRCVINCNRGCLENQCTASNVMAGTSDIVHSIEDVQHMKLECDKQEFLQTCEFVRRGDSVDDVAHESTSNKSIPVVGDCMEQDVEHTNCNLHHNGDVVDDEQLMEMYFR